MTRRAARRRRWKLAIGMLAVAGACIAWWWHGGGRLPGFGPQVEAPPAPVTVVLPITAATVATAQRAIAPPASASTAASPPGSNPPSTQDQIAELDAAQARDEAWAAARRESIRVQQRLREEAAEQRARVNALETDDAVRCIEGRRMRRVSNGWVDAGTC